MDDNDMEVIRESFARVEQALELEQESYWSGLTPQQQLWAFCAVMRRVCEAELVENRSYRGVLYGKFGWGPEAYMPAQLAGFLSIHNAIWPEDHERRILEAFCKQQNILDAENKINGWFQQY